jgi:pyruvate kinase
MSRIRSDIPIYAFTPHVATSRRVSLYRGVFPVPFEQSENVRGALYRSVFESLLSRELVEIGDFVIVTKGDEDGVSGGTNSMSIIEVTKPA